MQPLHISQEQIDKTISLGRLLLQFGKVQRGTRHEDGITPETDAEHTVMLGVIGCAFAAAFRPELNLGQVAQFALVHDLVEAYAGDVKTIKISEEDRRRKDEIEKEAHERLGREFGDVYPWIYETIAQYESLTTPEARFVKTLDKAMPSILHYLSKGAGPKAQGFSKEEVMRLAQEQHERLRSTYGYDQPEALFLRAKIAEMYLKDYGEANFS